MKREEKTEENVREKGMEIRARNDFHGNGGYKASGVSSVEGKTGMEGR